jgi:hypothetical protein
MTQTHQAKPLPAHETLEPRKVPVPAVAPVKRDERSAHEDRDGDDRELPFTD